jgi:hypothetical protein
MIVNVLPAGSTATVADCEAEPPAPVQLSE